ncbi:nitroreductase family protein [Amycolatopsis sp. NPDC051903]|uniref:nitroreductase family protein n=1 Tax=Amycolatopsis sp. NPDC051903 TaxID=3363936 RepID=UPI0037942A31
MTQLEVHQQARVRRQSPLRRLKWRLQFTGWLQYLPTAAVAVALLLVSAVVSLVSAPPALLIAAASALVFAGFGFDVVTMKLGFRPREPRPARRDDLDAFDLIRSRRSCRSFQRRDLTAADRAELLRVAREHVRPAALIGARPIRLEYLAAALTVWPTVGAHEFLVAIAPREYDRTAMIDVGRSLHAVVLHAARMGLATCWIGPGADQTAIAARLGARFQPDRDHVVCVCAIGYRSRLKPLTVRAIELVQRRRLPVPSLFFADTGFRRPLPVSTPPFAAFGRTYEACQWSPSSFNSQTTRCVALTDDAGTAVRRLDFFTATSSRYYAPVALGIWCANWEAGCTALGIRGHFRVLTFHDRGVSAEAEVPRYGVSWLAGAPA